MLPLLAQMAVRCDGQPRPTSAAGWELTQQRYYYYH
jgi:hypothetical protein